jgi:hypothetical protein
MIGEVFGRWTVVSEKFLKECDSTETRRRRRSYVSCKCDCGNVSEVAYTDLQTGHSKSCGCLLLDTITTHGLSKTPTYVSWKNMKTRCTNTNTPKFYNYGGRGVSYDPKWETFEGFYQDMGDRPSLNHSLDRVDPNGHYTKNNCRWATVGEQNLNKRDNVRHSFGGESKTLVEWAESLGVPAKRLYNRYANGWDIERVLTTPIKKINHMGNCEIKYRGNVYTKVQLAELFGISAACLTKRLQLGWSMERIANTPTMANYVREKSRE